MRFLHNEVSSEALQGYVHQGTQIEQIWQQVEEQVTELTLQGMAPWEAYSQMGYALAFVRACRLDVVLVQQLLEGADPKGTGSIPRATYDQAQVLGEFFEPCMEEAIKALDTRYVSGYRIPLRLRRAPSEGRPAAPHFLGVMAAGRETREWAAGLVAQYEVAIGAPKLPIPHPITAHLEAMKNQLALGDFHLESGLNLLGGIRSGKPVADALCAQGENLLWEAMESFYQVGQLVAYPGAWTRATPVAPAPAPERQRPDELAPVTPPPSKHAQVSTQVSDLLNQLGPAYPAGEPGPSSPGVSDLLKDLQMKASSSPPPQSPSSAATLLDQLHLTPPPSPAPAPSKPGASELLDEIATPPGVPNPSSSTSGKSSPGVQDILSELQFTPPPDPPVPPPSGASSASSHKQTGRRLLAEKKGADLLFDRGGEPKDGG
jgi:hypothetical protein